VLDVLVPEVVLQRADVMAIVGELEAAGMAEHVWVDREWGLADALDVPFSVWQARAAPAKSTNTSANQWRITCRRSF
jgi:hypothetical protein